MSTPFDIEVKRFYWPGSFKSACPKCGKKQVVKGEERYLSYPTANKPFDFYFSCVECSAAWSVKAILHLSLEVLP